MQPETCVICGEPILSEGLEVCYDHAVSDADDNPANPQATAYRVHCPTHDVVQLNYEEYMRQLFRPNSFWECPLCKEVAEWDDAHYERIAFGEEEE